MVTATVDVDGRGLPRQDFSLANTVRWNDGNARPWDAAFAPRRTLRTRAVAFSGRRSPVPFSFAAHLFMPSPTLRTCASTHTYHAVAALRAAFHYLPCYTMPAYPPRHAVPAVPRTGHACLLVSCCAWFRCHCMHSRVCHSVTQLCHLYHFFSHLGQVPQTIALPTTFYTCSTLLLHATMYCAIPRLLLIPSCFHYLIPYTTLQFWDLRHTPPVFHPHYFVACLPSDILSPPPTYPTFLPFLSLSPARLG